MKTSPHVRETILKWYRTLPFAEAYDAEFFSALDSVFVDGAWTVETYDTKCENGRQNLLAYLYFLDAMQARYREKGIPEEIFLDSAGDVVRWCDAWSRAKGELYLGELNWLRFSYTLKLFKLGRLQFCHAKTKYELPQYDLHPKDPVLEIHIPASGPLDLEECKKSIAMAREFFPRYYPEKTFKCFTCHSWLLDPTHGEIMKEGSNILAFSSLFDIVGKDESDSLLGYIFHWGIRRNELESAVPTTTLAATVKETALKGRTFYAGIGIIV